MLCKKIKIGSKIIIALNIKLQKKNFILLRGSRGYIMCGYLDLKTADKFSDVAMKIVGVSNIRQALNAKVVFISKQAKKQGLYRGQSVNEALRIIA